MWSGLTKVTPKRSKPIKSSTIKTETDLDKMLESHPTIASLPANKELITKLSALAPVSNNHVYTTMDSGASIRAACMQTHVPGHFVRRSTGQRNGEFAQTANGERLYNEGEFESLASVMVSLWVSVYEHAVRHPLCIGSKVCCIKKWRLFL